MHLCLLATIPSVRMNDDLQCLQEAGIPLMIHAGYPSDANGRDDATMGENIAVCAFLIAAQEYSYVAVGQGWSGPTCCPADSKCCTSNPYYSQCLPLQPTPSC